MKRIAIHFLPLVGLGVGVAAVIHGPAGNVLDSGISFTERLRRMEANFVQQWPVAIGAPVGTAFAAGLAKGFGNPRVSVGPLSFSAF